MNPGPITKNRDVLTVLWRNIFFVRWKTPATQPILEAVSRDYTATVDGSRAPVYCGISGDGAGTPDNSIQRKLVEMAAIILRQAPEFHLVLEGTSTQASLSRSLFRGIITAAKVGNRVLGPETRQIIHKVAIHDTLVACLPRLAVHPLIDAPPSVLRAEVEKFGLFTD